VVVANYGPSNVTVMFGAGAKGLTAAAIYAAEKNPYSVAAADFDGDGRGDFAVANAGAGTVSVFKGDGRGGFGPPLVFKTGAYPRGLVVADFDFDGRADLAVVESSSDSVLVLHNGCGPAAVKTR
jgi:hypothetical protein